MPHIIETVSYGARARRADSRLAHVGELPSNTHGAPVPLEPAGRSRIAEPLA